MIIDLRSDTVTRPTPQMLEFMFSAKVGDDVFGEDPTVNELQAFAAEMFGMEAALFCPSGTMTNQIAIKAHTQPGDEVICEEGAHVHYYEGGGIAFNSGASTKTLVGQRGVFTAEQVLDSLRPENVHFPRTSLVCMENTCNRGGGKIFDFHEIERIKDVCQRNKLKLHLDGARLFNAVVVENRSPKDFGNVFDSISICLSKGLGAPVGSLLIGNQPFIHQATRIRKVLGGGMRQAGFMAAAGLYALSQNVNRLQEDHVLAKSLEKSLKGCEFVSSVLEVETNIVVFKLNEGVKTPHFLEHLRNSDIYAFEVGKQRIRFVTHLNLPQDCFSIIEKALASYSSAG
ncbi:MAG: aminotransferase class I/II-fold pyridoxal phosphate-dependent enzyme [Flavobacteriales bacterium]|nr:aminotransferase class I/II-fold pyridoxal phosphate-dependent enzyme [Flavobacteriales bacterium]